MPAVGSALVLLLGALLVGAPSARAAAVGSTAEVLATAVVAANAAGDHSAVAVLDTRSGEFYGAGDVDGQFPTESIVKVLIAAKLLATGQLTAARADVAEVMITQSDDSAADQLWGLADGPNLISWAEQRYGIENLGAAPSPSSQWGNTKITARGLVQLYAALERDPAVGPWLLAAMHDMSPTASDGTDQTFGLPSASSGGAYKQGWGGDDDDFDSEGLLSTGFLDSDRFVVAVFAQHIPWISLQSLVPVIDSLGAAAELTVHTVAAASALPVSVPAAVPASAAASDPAGTPVSAAAPDSAAAPAVDHLGQARTSAGGFVEPRSIRLRYLLGIALSTVLLAGLLICIRRRGRNRIGDGKQS